MSSFYRRQQTSLDRAKISQFIVDLRKSQNLTQQDFADQLYVSFQAVSKWETGKSIPSLEVLRLIGKKFSIDVSGLLDLPSFQAKPQTWHDWVKKHQSIMIIIGLLVISGLIIFLTTRSSSGQFKFKELSSQNQLFTVDGVVAFSKDRSSIYISNIDYHDTSSAAVYKTAECNLYEVDGNKRSKIEQCGNISDPANSGENLLTLSELLKSVKFKIDDYSSTCKHLKSGNLVLEVNAVNQNDQIVTYKMPLEVAEQCNH